MLMAFDFNHLILVSLLSSVRIGGFGHIYNLILAIGLSILSSITVGFSILSSITVGFSIFSSIAIGLRILGIIAVGLRILDIIAIGLSNLGIIAVGLRILDSIIVGLNISGVLVVSISVSVCQWLIVRSVNLRLALFNNPVDVPFLILTLDNIGKAVQLVVQPCSANILVVAPEGVDRAALFCSGWNVPCHDVVDPADGLADVSVDPRGACLSTAHSPGHDTCLDVAAVSPGTDEGAATVSFTGVFTRLSPGTEEGVVETESLAEAGLAKFGLTSGVVHNGKVDLFQDDLVIAIFSKLVLAPTSGETCATNKILKFKVLLWFWKTDRIDVEIHDEVLSSEEDSKIVEKSPSKILWMNIESIDISVLVWIRLVLGLRVPFSTSNFQGCSQGPSVTNILVNAVSCREYGTIRDQGCTADKVVDGRWVSSAVPISDLLNLFSQQGAHVGPLANLRLKLIESGDPGAESIEVSLAPHVRPAPLL